MMNIYIKQQNCEFFNWLGFKPSLVVTHLSIEQMCQPLSSHLIFKNVFFTSVIRIIFGHFSRHVFGESTESHTQRWRNWKLQRETIVTADFHQAFQTSSSCFPPSAVAQRTASFLFITDEIRHNQVNQRDITQWSIISVCFQPDSL